MAFPAAQAKMSAMKKSPFSSCSQLFLLICNNSHVTEYFLDVAAHTPHYNQTWQRWDVDMTHTVDQDS